MSGLDYGDTLKLQQQIRRMESEFDRFIKQFLLRQALDALAKTKDNTPVDTGLLRASWTISELQRAGNDLVITISNPTEYASFVEYGHMTRDRRRWIEGRFMCTLAIDEVSKLIPQRFAAEFAVWVGRMSL